MSKAYEFDGKVKVIFDTVTFPSGFTKREFVVTEPGDRYPQDVKFNMIRENCALLDSFKPGDAVRVTFNLRGNLYKDKYYTDLQAFKIAKLEPDGSTAEPIAQPADDFPVDTLSDDDMPF